MVGIQSSAYEIAEIAAKNGFSLLGIDTKMLESKEHMDICEKAAKDAGIGFDLLPLPADMFHWDTEGKAFDEAVEKLKAWAELGERLGAKNCFSHIWSSSKRPFDENFQWHAERVALLESVLKPHGIRFGMEFLGPHELRSFAEHEFVHSIAGVLAIADAAGGSAGVVFDAFHWLCSANMCPDDLYLMAQHPERLVSVHLNDGIAGVDYKEQKDGHRLLPMESGVINTADMVKALSVKGTENVPVVIEPFNPWCGKLEALEVSEAVKTLADAFEKVGL